MESTKIAVFKGREVRKTIHNNEWWFSITDIIEALTENGRPRKYWNDLKKKLIKEGYSEVSEKIGQLKGYGQIATPLVVETEGSRSRKAIYG